ncbi:MAG TPA: class I SAM-dependent methyltransferase [Chitinophagaceae bacterium]|nr:class I SAM-dependent methyltransferase [Chitinophagaceae bacterium]
MERLYEHWLNPQIAYSQNQKGDWLDFHLQYAQEIMQILAYFKKPSSSLNVFDFGMGWGKWSLMAKAFGCNSYGTELSQHRINNAVSNGINVITWDEIPQHKFDFINTEQVFEHLAEPLKTMEHLKQALKPNGLLKISVPTATDMERRLKIMDWMSPKGAKNSLNPVAPLEHINFYRRKSLLKMASAAGLKEAPLSIRLQYQYALDLSGFKKFVKSMIRPINRTVFKTQNYVFFCKE